ncbi:MAG: nitrogen fixation protein NifH [Candidatus Thorarchaeota archaeon]|nr:nitrogen fixation protein NifH [Candidatus Thorarchaeota archaeon]
MRPQELIDESIVSWLLEHSDPSVRYWALQNLQGLKPAHEEVRKAQDVIMASDCVRRILSAQNTNGAWGDANDMYNPKYTATTHSLLILAELGAKRTQAIERAIEHLFRFQRTSGHFLGDLPKTEKGRSSAVKDGCCLDGNILYYLSHFGFLDDSRTQSLIDFQVEYYNWENTGWPCRAYPINPERVFPSNCYMGRIKNLKGLASIPSEKRSKDVQKIIRSEIEVILENQLFRYLRNPDGSRKAKVGWTRFGFPLFYQSDVLEVLDMLTGLGVRDERMQDSIDLVVKNRRDDGKWILKNTYNGKMLCNIEEKGQPSKWITLRALRVLKRLYGEDLFQRA